MGIWRTGGITTYLLTYLLNYLHGNAKVIDGDLEDWRNHDPAMVYHDVAFAKANGEEVQLPTCPCNYLLTHFHDHLPMQLPTCPCNYFLTHFHDHLPMQLPTYPCNYLLTHVTTYLPM